MSRPVLGVLLFFAGWVACGGWMACGGSAPSTRPDLSRDDTVQPETEPASDATAQEESSSDGDEDDGGEGGQWQEDLDALAAYEESLLEIEEELSEAVGDMASLECVDACELNGQICELSQRICGIYERHPEDGGIHAMCQDSEIRCRVSSKQVTALCACWE